MNKGADLAKSFYDAFHRRDAATMNSHYGESVSFSDPVFPGLDGKETRAMWDMLTKSAKEFSVEHTVVSASDTHADIEWTARYLFSKTGRPVVNKVRTHMKIKNGRIFEQKDEFDFALWAKQAFGLVGTLIGWMPFFQKKVQATARQGLDKHLGRNS